MELRGFGSFHVGGREIAITGRPVREMLLTPGGAPTRVDPNGVYVVEQMYVQYLVPARRRGAVPLLLWHGGGLTGVAYETTPDGRPGWLDYFVRRGWDTYVSDAVERGRAGFPPPGVFDGDPVFVPKNRPFEAFRIGQGPGSYDEDPAKRRQLPGSQFPMEGYDALLRQQAPRWTTTDDAILRAYLAEIDRVCPCVVLFHSQAGQFGFKAAQLRPDKVRALVAVEPSGFGEPGRAAALKDIPTLVLYGDNIEQDARWPVIRGNGLRWVETQNAAGGRAEVIQLPALGIRGNSHLMMMDRNNAQVAGVIADWLRDKGLVQDE
ncbi:esterase [Methylobacterium sp. 17Sr1-1]|nr:esterase [Methylobacterium sp. 17Sr1-1]